MGNRLVQQRQRGRGNDAAREQPTAGDPPFLSLGRPQRKFDRSKHRNQVMGALPARASARAVGGPGSGLGAESHVSPRSESTRRGAGGGRFVRRENARRPRARERARAAKAHRSRAKRNARRTPLPHRKPGPAPTALARARRHASHATGAERGRGTVKIDAWRPRRVELDAQYRVMRESAGVLARRVVASLPSPGPRRPSTCRASSRTTSRRWSPERAATRHCSTARARCSATCACCATRTAFDRHGGGGGDAVLRHLSMYKIGRDVEVVDRTGERSADLGHRPGGRQVALDGPAGPENSHRAVTSAAPNASRRTDPGVDLLVARRCRAVLEELEAAPSRSPRRPWRSCASSPADRASVAR